MNAIDKLKTEAREKRDTAIKTARDEYRETLTAIRKLDRRMRSQPGTRVNRSTRRRSTQDGPLSSHTAVSGALVVLGELGPLQIPELVVELQGRGCRSGDDPRILAANLRASFRRHSDRFVRGEDGRWGIYSSPSSP